MKIPRVILEGEDYRKSTIAEVKGVTEAELINPGVDVESGLLLTEEFKKTKDKTNYALTQLYEQKGYDVFKEVCGHMKQNNWFENKDYGKFKGEACEVFILITIKEFIQKFELPWKVYSSLVVDSTGDKKLTELDIVLVTEEIIIVFEAKSYNNPGSITDKCTIKDKDIYAQNALHCKSLVTLISDLNITGGKRGMKSAFFWYASGSIKDARDDKYKAIMPLITEENLMAFLTAISNLNEKSWKPEIYQKIEELSTMYTMEDHQKAVGYKD